MKINFGLSVRQFYEDFMFFLRNGWLRSKLSHRKIKIDFHDKTKQKMDFTKSFGIMEC